MSEDISSDSKEEEDTASRLSDNRSLISGDRSLLSGDHSVDYSTQTGVTRETYGSISTYSASSQVPGSYSALSSARRKVKSAPVRGFKPQSNAPPLDFGATGLVGRENEVTTLKACYDRLMTRKANTRHKELVLVGGQSGVGKSCVVRSCMAKDILLEGVFVEGN